MRALNRERGRPAASKAKELKRERQKNPKITKVEERREENRKR